MSLIILQWTINAFAIVVAVKTINGISFHGKWWYMLIIGAIFGVVNSFIRPVIKLFTLPIIILTLGIFTLIINASMLTLTALISKYFKLGLVIDGFWPAIYGALVVSIVSMVLTWITGIKQLRQKPEGRENRQKMN
jgi:putative membrane protein